MLKLLALVGFTLSLSQFSFSAEKLVLTGSSTVAPLLGEIAKRFEKSHNDVRVDVQTGGSSRGIADTRQGVADIGMVSRALKPSEKDLTAFTVAMDGIGMIVHSSNPIEKLTQEQILNIYKGKVKSWKNVGGPDKSVTVVNKAEGRSTLELFLKHFQLKPYEIKASVIIGDNEQGIKTVAGNPNAIGYVSIGAAEFSISQGVNIKLLPLNGIVSSTENVRNGRFPLSRPLNLVAKGEVSGLKKQFIEFAKSSEVSDLVRDQYFVSVEQ
ncbi:MAG: ABC transporter substrate-binding protein [Bdellovibrionaceae bacterium]|nr:ABC transporter substrate-binding protein [Pseudobdellovibrionaceae bacterium]